MKTMHGLSRDREDEFYDAREELSCPSDSDCSEDRAFSVPGRSMAEKFGGVLERRRKFFKWMGLDKDLGVASDSDSYSGFNSDSDSVLMNTSKLGNSEIQIELERVTETSGAVLRTSNFGETRSSSESSLASASNSSNEALIENFACKAVNSNGKSLFETENYFVDVKRKFKKNWLRKLGIGMCVVDVNRDSTVSPNKIEVYPYKKRTKELSSLHAGQEIRAHEGSILTMKFSLDGNYLASAGEDGIVRVWKVNEDARSNIFDSAVDPSCRCFTIDHLSKIDPLEMNKEKLIRSDSACVVYPPKIFSILDKPLHEFRGHTGEVLDLSWSSKGFLLSSSIDKTVRLWQVGCERCLRVFFHNNYVTCVDFNPRDDNHFISGSIDGKVRIWEVRRCRVVDYIDIHEIVTAVSYRPDGKGGIVGSMTGTCLFYNIIDDRLQLDAQICLPGKKKSPGKRITGFKFTPDDPSKVMVTSADSLVRVVCGNNVICKFKGLRSSASQASASFTSDGKHIVSATEDSNVYIWNYSRHEKTSFREKTIWPSESFHSRNASIAIPWCGSKVNPDTIPFGLENPEQKVSLSSPDCFSLTGFLESLPRGTATWPEEKLVNSSGMTNSPLMRNSKFKFLKNALQSMSGSPHMWGLVIVTAGWDGRIRTFLNYGLPLRI